MPFSVLFPGIQTSSLGSRRAVLSRSGVLAVLSWTSPSFQEETAASGYLGWGFRSGICSGTLTSLPSKDFQTSSLSLSSKSTPANSTLQESQILAFSYDQVRYHNSMQNENKIKSECPCHFHVSGLVTLFPRTGTPSPSPLSRPKSRSFFKNHVSLPSCIGVILPSILWNHKGGPGSVLS